MTHNNGDRSALAWPPQKIAELTRMYVDDGLTMTEIGRRMGLSKNAIIGKVARLGLVRGSGFVPTVQQAGRLRQEEMRGRQISTLASRLDALDVFPGFGECVFPIGRPGAEGFHFCAAKVPADNLLAPFCAEHQAVAWQAGKPRAYLDSPEFVARRRA